MTDTLNTNRVVSDAEMAMILHALRYYQEKMLGVEGCCSSCRLDCGHFEDVEELGSVEIDDLCVVLNSSTVTIDQRPITAIEEHAHDDLQR